MKPLNFTDNFSRQAEVYKKYRPGYPKELYRFLSELTPNHDLAWDCGTGNGQAAVDLVEFYDHVIATDPSSAQIQWADTHSRVEYRVEKSEENSLNDHSADIVTVANAMHWFDLERFYSEVRRIVKPGGVIAAWTYSLFYISPEIDIVVKDFHDNVVGEFWQYENRLVEQEYRTIPFPFAEIEAPQFVYEREMNLEDVIGYLNTWSAVQKYITKYNINPTESMHERLAPLWGAAQSSRTMTWRLVLKVGRV